MSKTKKRNRSTAKEVTNNKVAAAKRLITTCEKELFANEYGLMTIRGVENLSREDVNNIIFYCNYYVENKTLAGLMPPCGSVADVLTKIELVKNEELWF